MDKSRQFKALVVEKTADGRFAREIRERRVNDLPPGDQVTAGSERPMMKERWGGCVDVGGDTLAAAIQAMLLGGSRGRVVVKLS